MIRPHRPLLLVWFSIGALTAQSPAPQRPPTSPTPRATALAIPAPTTTVIDASTPPAVGDASRPDSRLPTASFAAAMTDVHFDRPEVDGPLWAIGQNWKASFDASGFTFIPFFGSDAPRNFPLRLRLAQATVGGRLLELVDGRPLQDGASVRTGRGALTEVVALRLGEVEQSFVFTTLPERAAIRVDIAIESELTCEPIAGGLQFANAHGRATYRKAVAMDASGAIADLDIVWTGSAAHIEIPADFVRRAHLPLILDPVLQSNLTASTPSSTTQDDPDVAVLQAAGGRTLMTWRRVFSATDHDLWAIVLNDNLTPTTPNLALDFTSLDYLHASVAANNQAQNFMVASEVLAGTLYYIAGRTVSATGVTGPVFDIERQFVVGGFGNNHSPDIGSDPYPGPGYYCVVFEKQIASTRDIYFKLVNTNGTLPNPNPTPLDLSGDTESLPRISKSCGPDNGLGTHWLVTWQRNDSSGPTNYSVLGAFVNWDGAIIRSAFTIANTASDETTPSASSPADIEGNRMWMVAYAKTTPSGTRDIACNLVYLLPGIVVLIGELVLANPDDDLIPDTDSDGARFVVGRSSLGLSGFNTSAITIGYSVNTLSFYVHEVAGLATTAGLELGTSICARHSGGALPSPSYLVAGINGSTNSIEVYDYGGFAAGPLYGVVPTQCGTLSINASGIPAIGNTVTFTVGNGAASGTIFGYPGSTPLNGLGCNCVLGVSQGLFYGNPLVWSVPVMPQFVGTTLAVQGFTLLGSQCLSSFDLSDTIQFTLR